MAQDAAASGATSDADSTTGDDSSDAGTTGDQQPPNIDKIVAARVGQALRKYGDLDELKRKAAEYDSLKESTASEKQTLSDRIAALEAERGRDRIDTATIREAAKLGFRDPEDALAHIARRIDAVQIDKDGKPTNVSDLLSALLKDKPYLAGVSGSADGGQRGDSSEKAPTMNELLRAAAGQ